MLYVLCPESPLVGLAWVGTVYCPGRFTSLSVDQMLYLSVEPRDRCARSSVDQSI
jgi:hypothetical protein